MSRVVHFEIQADDLPRIMKFYEEVLGWKFTPFGGGDVEYYLVTTGPDSEPGINGGIMKRNGPTNLVYNSSAVDDIDAAVERIVKAGGEIALPKMPIPGIGWVAYGKDPEGVIFGVHQEDRNVK